MLDWGRWMGWVGCLLFSRIYGVGLRRLEGGWEREGLTVSGVRMGECGVVLDERTPGTHVR